MHPFPEPFHSRASARCCFSDDRSSKDDRHPMGRTRLSAYRKRMFLALQLRVQRRMFINEPLAMPQTAVLQRIIKLFYCKRAYNRMSRGRVSAECAKTYNNSYILHFQKNHIRKIKPNVTTNSLNSREG
jgi:hypothetical protein